MVDLLGRLSAEGGQRRTQERRRVVIGTHALMQEQSPSGPAVVIDEQHRFGVEQRAARSGRFDS
jgi:RecG-like helicase